MVELSIHIYYFPKCFQIGQCAYCIALVNISGNANCWSVQLQCME